MMRPNCTKKVTQLAKNSNHVQFWGILRGLFRCSVDFIVMFTVMVIADMIQFKCSKAPKIAFNCQISMSMTTVSLWLTKCSQVQKCGVIRLKFLVTVIHPAMHWSMLLTDLSWYCNRYRAGRATENSLKVLAGHLLYLVQMRPSPCSDTYVCSTWPLTLVPPPSGTVEYKLLWAQSTFVKAGNILYGTYKVDPLQAGCKR